nr:aldehyde dehydrogenase family protein [Candidatus Neomarinimicrobiota bacterium]
MALISINPATGDEIKTYPKHSPVEIGYILNQASQAQKSWCNTDLDFRISCLEQTAGTLRDRAKEYAKLMAMEMGKPLSQGLGEVEKCAWLCEYYAEKAKPYLVDKEVDISGQKSL